MWGFFIVHRSREMPANTKQNNPEWRLTFSLTKLESKHYLITGLKTRLRGVGQFFKETEMKADTKGALKDVFAKVAGAGIIGATVVGAVTLAPVVTSVAVAGIAGIGLGVTGGSLALSVHNKIKYGQFKLAV